MILPKSIENKLNCGRVLCVVGSGELLSAVVGHDPCFKNGRQLALWAVEPDEAKGREMRALFPQPRIQWAIGANWRDEMTRALTPGSMVPPPFECFAADSRHSAICHEVIDVVQRWSKQVTDLRAQVATPYPIHDPPRIMLVTSRFTTVIQHVTNEVALAFRDRGWEEHVIIERAPWHVIDQGTIAVALRDFQPDLIFCIDNMRHELPAIPKHIQYVCWATDHMMHFFEPGAPDLLGDKDFLMTFSRSLFERLGYPKRQVIDSPMFFVRQDAPPIVPASAPVPDLVYIAHNSNTVEAMYEHRLRCSLGIPGVKEALDKLVQVYRDGGTSYNRVGDVLRMFPDNMPVAMKLCAVEYVMAPMSSLLYRQQGLRWVISAAEELGLTLGLYGDGWDKNPEFSKYAKGAVIGDERNAVMRQAKINLYLEQYPSASHARCLDALRCGGFVLQRELPLTMLTRRLSTWLYEHNMGHVRSREEVVDAGPEFENLADELSRHVWDVDGDPVRSTVIMNATHVANSMPWIDDVIFKDAASCRERIACFMEHPEMREKIAADQWRVLGPRLGYRGGIARMLSEMGFFRP